MRRDILFLFDNLEVSGADRVALDVARALYGLGVPVRLAVCMDVKDGIGDLPGNLVCLSPPATPGEGLLRRAWRGGLAVLRCAHMVSKSTVIICVTPPAAFVGLVAGALSGARSIPWAHFDLAGVLREPLAARGLTRGLLQRFFYGFVVPLHRQVIFVSNEARTSMAREARRGIVPPGWTVLPNVVESRGRAARTCESATAGRIAALKAGGRRVVLFIGRIARQKRWEHLVAAAALLAGEEPACTLVLIGDGPEREQLESALERAPAGCIEYLGPDPNPMPSLALADVLVLSSLYEAWPTVILEAFQLRVPVIAYDCPSGPREMLGTGGARGRLIEQSAAALALAVAQCLAADAFDEEQRRTRAAVYAGRFLPEVAAAEWKVFLDTA